MDLKKCSVFFLLSFLILVPGIVAGDPQPIASESPVSAAGRWDDGWYSGAEGYAKAIQEYEQTNKPMAIYINVNWCPYCRKFEKEILSNPEVKASMKDVIKVHLNPESGRTENAITFQYGVTGFPSFYVHPPQPSGTVRLYTGVTPQQFVELFKKVLK